MFGLIDDLRAIFGFKREPIDIGDNDVAFLGFLNFASGDSIEARMLQAIYFNATGKRPCNDMPATAAQTGEYIDWLIETQWGENVAAADVH